MRLSLLLIASALAFTGGCAGSRTPATLVFGVSTDADAAAFTRQCVEDGGRILESDGETIMCSEVGAVSASYLEAAGVTTGMIRIAHLWEDGTLRGVGLFTPPGASREDAEGAYRALREHVTEELQRAPEVDERNINARWVGDDSTILVLLDHTPAHTAGVMVEWVRD